MDAQRFDALAKALAARSVSRRTIVTAVAGLVAGSPQAVVRPAGSSAAGGTPPATPPSTRDDDQPASGDEHDAGCPACGACQTCSVERATSAVTCGAPCADSCLAGTLCEEALRDGAYRLLADALAADGFAPTGEPQAIAIEEDGVLLAERLAAEYADRQKPARSATLVFLRESGGDDTAHAVVRQGQIPEWGFVVAADGHVERVVVNVAERGDGTSPAPRSAASSTVSCYGCDACDFLCHVGGEVVECLAIGFKLCKTAVCHVALDAICAATLFLGCHPFCEFFGCAVCDEHCENRAPDCLSCIDRCQQMHPDQRCVEGRCRCVEDDPRVGATCGPVDAPICCEPLRCEACDYRSGRCQSRCRPSEWCCGGNCRGDAEMVPCGNTCCPFLEGLICCDDACVNWQIDPEHCGECGVRCAEEEICDLGRCRGCDSSLCEAFTDGQCVVVCRAGEVCDPERGCLPGELLDVSICPTLLSEADLLELVAGGTSVTSLTSFDGEDDQGNITFLCLWDVVGNPQPSEPWFDWLVSVQAAIKVRGDVSTAAWEESLATTEAELGCKPATLLDDRTSACLSDRPEAVDLTVRLDADRFLWLLLTSSKTGGAPDYPVLREATERIAAFLIARLAAPRR